MNKQNIISLYKKDGDGWNEALEAYKTAIEEFQGNEEKLNELAFLAADFAHSEALTLLFEAGVPPSITSKYNFTLLHHLALQMESQYHAKPKGAIAQTTALLLDNKVSAIRKDDNESMCSYHYAARNGLFEMVEVMAERKVKLNMTDKEGNTGIHIACEYFRHAAYSKILCEEDFFRVVKAFASGGVDIEEKNNYDKTALKFAIENNAKKIAAFLSGSLTDENDASVIAAGGMTLHEAAEKGDSAAIKALAEAGADINGLKDGEKHKLGGCTPLAVACAFLQKGAVETLLSCGADPSFKDGNGRAALSYILTDLKETPNSRIFEEKNIPKIIKDMSSAGMDINMTIDDDGNTLLTLACKAFRGAAYKQYTHKGVILEEAMKLKPNLNLANRFGETALMHACAKDFEIMEKYQIDFLEQGADVLAADKNGDTALHYACRNDNKTGAKSLCDMLLEFGADINAANNKGKTALDIATEQDNEPLVKLLLSKM